MNLQKIKEIEKTLEDVEFYSPTIPLSYQKYHEIIRELIKHNKNLEDKLYTHTKESQNIPEN